MGILSRATRNITRRKARAALVIVALGLALAILITLPASITANQQASQKAIDAQTKVIQRYSLQLNAVATEIDCKLPLILDFGPEPQPTIMYPLMNLTDYAGLSLMPGVEKVIPILIQDQWASQEEYLYDVYGIPLEAPLLDRYPSILPSNITAGRNLRADDSGVVVLDERVAGNLSVSIGDTVNILGQNFTVVGIKGWGYQGLEQFPTGVFMSLGDAQHITNTTGQVSFFQVFATSVENVDSIAENIKGLYPKLEIQTATYIRNTAQDTQTRLNADIEAIQNTMNQVQSTATVEMALAVAAQGALILVIMLYTVRGRTKEIGTLKAMGASNTTILGQFMLEGTFLSLIAGIIGIAIGTVGASMLGQLLLPHFNHVDIDLIMGNDGVLRETPIAVNVTPELVLFGLGVAVLLGVLGSLYPAWRAARTRPAEAMRYE